MGIRESHIEENIKNITMELEVRNFKDVGYWIRDLKQKLKKFGLVKIKARFEIHYFDDGTTKDNKYIEYIKEHGG